MDRLSPMPNVSPSRTRIVLAAACLALGAGPIWAQPSPRIVPGGPAVAEVEAGEMPAGTVGGETANGSMPATTNGSTAASMPLIEESPLETFYLQDEDGNFVPLIKAFTYEEFEEFQSLKRDLENPSAPTAFFVQSLDLDVRIDPDAVAATAAVAVKLNRTGWSRVPLRFDEMLLDGAPTWDGARDVQVEYDLPRPTWSEANTAQSES